MPQHPFSQYPPNMQQLLPGFTPPPLPPIQQTPQQFHPSLHPPRPTILPAKPIPNPNNRPPLPLHNADFQNFPAYAITPIPVKEIQLGSRRTLQTNQPIKRKPPVVVIQEEGDDTAVDLSTEVPLPDVIIPKNKEENSHQDQPTQASRYLPFQRGFL